MIETYKAVIFDMDGTLIDSMWVWPEIDKAYLERFHIIPPEDMEEELEGMSFTETAAYFKKRFQLNESIDAIKAAWNELAWVFYTEKIDVKAGVREFLELLTRKHVKLGIATSNSIELTLATLTKLRIRDYFQVIRTSCEVEKGKPYPYIYLKVAEDLGVSPNKCLVFEDIPNGVRAAKRAGMDVWAIEDNQDEAVKKVLYELADKFVSSYQEAAAYFMLSKS